MLFSYVEKLIGESSLIFYDRLRANLWRLRGAKIAPKTRVGKNCIIERPWNLDSGKNVTIEHRNFIKIVSEKARVSIGDHTFLGHGSELDISEELVIGNNVLIAPRCFITDHNHRIDASELIANQGCESRPICIKDDVWLGAHVVVLSGVTIGKGAVVAAQAVVTKDIEPYSVVAGVPAKFIRLRENSKIILGES